MPQLAHDLFVVDATFLVKKSQQAFLGASLLEVDGIDHTFTYGVCREFLRLRQALGAARLGVIFGSETYAESADAQKVNRTAQLLKDLGLRVVDEPKYSIVDICMASIDNASHFVSENTALLQFTVHGATVILVDIRMGNTVFNADTVQTKFGIAPVLIPDLLALTEAPKDSRLTTPQAVRLLERFGGLKEILKAIDTDTLKRRSTAAKLKGNEERLLLHRAQLAPSGQKPEIQAIGSVERDLDTEENREALRLRRFHSLVRLLPTPKQIQLEPVEIKEHKGTYQSIVDAASLQRLVTAIRATRVCAIDTEATDKDPHRAELLGVSFCFKKGEAFYAPLTGEDLRDLSAGNVLEALQEIARCDVDFVGHNAKYDDVLLRRHGITLSRIGFDTMLAAHECFHDWEFFNLKHLAQVLLGKTIKKYGDVVEKNKNLLDVPFQRLVHYAHTITHISPPQRRPGLDTAPEFC
ncbi:hypothetical protein [Thiorhodovibrio litoralis]|uniref:hypothetical protein n=1 Tax=Thiorhodovibrio litoralis TaxID=2952932 RepID=UPI002B25FFAF|nr:hypothetical protein [Thiorhodovibrio litoralis]WPL10733.1 DNA polymerase I [Thiorhodovibrio litoralis]